MTAKSKTMKTRDRLIYGKAVPPPKAIIRCQCGTPKQRQDVSAGFRRGKQVWFCNACIPF